MGLLVPDDPPMTTNYSNLIQNFNRFLLEQLHQDCQADRLPRLFRSASFQQDASSKVSTMTPTIIQQLFGCSLDSISTCHTCSQHVLKPLTPFVIDMIYPQVNPYIFFFFSLMAI